MKEQDDRIPGLIRGRFTILQNIQVNMDLVVFNDLVHCGVGFEGCEFVGWIEAWGCCAG